MWCDPKKSSKRSKLFYMFFILWISFMQFNKISVSQEHRCRQFINSLCSCNCFRDEYECKAHTHAHIPFLMVQINLSGFGTECFWYHNNLQPWTLIRRSVDLKQRSKCLLQIDDVHIFTHTHRRAKLIIRIVFTKRQ